MAEKTPIEIEIRDERILEIFRGELPPHHQIVVTYQPAGVPVPRTIWILAEDIFGEETEEFLRQREAKAGPLYDRWLEIRGQKIRMDIEAQKAFKPERLTV